MTPPPSDLVPTLLPCPFCGGEGKVSPVRDGAEIRCRKCHSAGAPSYYPQAHSGAAAAWNARAGHAAALAGDAGEDRGVLAIAVRALKLIEHATAPGADDGHHENAWTLARQGLSDLKWGTVDGAAATGTARARDVPYTDAEKRVWTLLGEWISSVARPNAELAPTTEMVAAIKALARADAVPVSADGYATSEVAPPSPAADGLREALRELVAAEDEFQAAPFSIMTTDNETVRLDKAWAAARAALAQAGAKGG